MPMTKSGDGLTSCSCETERPQPERASIISGTDIDGNQYWPAIIVVVGGSGGGMVVVVVEVQLSSTRRVCHAGHVHDRDQYWLRF